MEEEEVCNKLTCEIGTWPGERLKLLNPTSCDRELRTKFGWTTGLGGTDDGDVGYRKFTLVCKKESSAGASVLRQVLRVGSLPPPCFWHRISTN